MIYIIGHTFTFNPHAAKPQASSIQEQMALNKVQGLPGSAPSKAPSMFDDRFIQGNQYRLAKIQKILKEEPRSEAVVYYFANTTNTNANDIDIEFPNTTKGDQYVAMLSGEVDKYKKERQYINEAYSSGNDL